MRRFRDIIHHNVYCVSPQTSIRELTRQLVERKIAGCPVVDEQGRVVGVVSFTDIAVKVVYPLPGQSGPQRVEEIMTTSVVTIPEESNVAQAVELFHKHHLHRLIVVQEERFVGLVTPWDLMLVLQERIPQGVPGSRRKSIPLQ